MGPVLATSSGSSCEYPEGHCDCVDETPPKGVMVPFEERTFGWRCRPWDPEAWPDGCPSAHATGGEKCSSNAVCAYGDEYDAVVYTCESGRWAGKLVQHPRPPPLP
jgi:hypothetical protein